MILFIFYKNHNNYYEKPKNLKEVYYHRCTQDLKSSGADGDQMSLDLVSDVEYETLQAWNNHRQSGVHGMFRETVSINL